MSWPPTTGEMSNLAASPQRTTTHAGVDFFSKIVIPIGAGVAAALTDNHSRMYAFAAMGVASIAFTSFPSATRVSRRMFRRYKDTKAARQMRPQLITLVERFGTFISDRSDTLHTIVWQDIVAHRVFETEKLGIIDRYLFNELWIELEKRAASDSSSLRDIVDRFVELETLYRSYYRYAVQPVFERLPLQVKKEISEGAQARLHDVRDRLARYAEDLESFGNVVTKVAIHLHATHFFFSRPLPLVMPKEM